MFFLGNCGMYGARIGEVRHKRKRGTLLDGCDWRVGVFGACMAGAGGTRTGSVPSAAESRPSPSYDYPSLFKGRLWPFRDPELCLVHMHCSYHYFFSQVSAPLAGTRPVQFEIFCLQSDGCRMMGSGECPSHGV